MANQNFEKAINLFTKAINKKQNTAEAFFARGLCYNLKKDFEKSTEDSILLKTLVLTTLNFIL